MESQEVQSRVSSVMEDPSTRSVAKVYAIAYLDSAGVDGAQAAVEELGSFVVDVLNANPEFDRLLRTPAISSDAKVELLEKVVVPRSSTLFADFIRVLARHDRLDVLPQIHEIAVHELERRMNQQRVEVTSAKELSPASLDAIRSSLASALSIQPILETRVDSSLIGGLTIRVGDTVYDGSLKSQVKQLRARLRERCLNEIQRGRDRFSYQDGN